MTIGLIVPVYKNFKGFAELMASVDYPIIPIIIPNWANNIGVSKAWNKGLSIAIDLGLDKAIVSNDDVTFRRGTIQKLVDGLNHYDLVTDVNDRDGFNHDREEYIYSPDYACFAVRPTQFVDRAGWFDESFSPAYFEDNDMAYRAKLAGMSQRCRLDAPMLHAGSITQNWEGVPHVTSEMFEKNKAYYVAKWGSTPRQEIFLTPFNNPTKTFKDW